MRVAEKFVQSPVFCKIDPDKYFAFREPQCGKMTCSGFLSVCFLRVHEKDEFDSAVDGDKSVAETGRLWLEAFVTKFSHGRILTVLSFRGKG